PAFSLLHEEEGVRIAKLNGATSAVSYWEKHLNQPLARAMAEYFSKTGAWFDSPHGQNFLVELDQDMKPTGRIVLRDLGDSYLLEDFVKNTPFAWIMKGWEDGKVVKNEMRIAIGLIHGNTLPSWMHPVEYKEYGWSFFRSFEKEFAKRSNIPVGELIKVDSKEALLSYTNKKYPTTSAAWQKFTHYSHCMGGALQTLAGEKCPEIFLNNNQKMGCLEAANILIAH
ncbi:MAG: hypothetical protein K2Q18_11065, partial [Bdellovibrionales bacterium]|nr:hypothetical protein [Bdellovibrionales bacterium]